MNATHCNILHAVFARASLSFLNQITNLCWIIFLFSTFTTRLRWQTKTFKCRHAFDAILTLPRPPARVPLPDSLVFVLPKPIFLTAYISHYSRRLYELFTVDFQQRDLVKQQLTPCEKANKQSHRNNQIINTLDEHGNNIGLPNIDLTLRVVQTLKV